ncbi:unnamed protein product [Mucor circinelloides]
MLRSIALLALFIIAYCSNLVSAASIHTNTNQWNRRPRQFRMQIFSRPDSKGAVQTIRATNGASTPCWNLASKRVGSYDLNDPLVKVTFYRVSLCRYPSVKSLMKITITVFSHQIVKVLPQPLFIKVL